MRGIPETPLQQALLAQLVANPDNKNVSIIIIIIIISGNFPPTSVSSSFPPPPSLNFSSSTVTLASRRCQHVFGWTVSDERRGDGCIE